MSDEQPILNTMTSTSMLEGLRRPENDQVWDQFVNRYRPMIVKYAARFGLDAQEAEDAAQHTLIAFCQSYQQGKYNREQGRLRVWLFGIARNQMLNYIKRRRDREIQVLDASQDTNFFARQPDEDQFEKAWEEEWRDAVLKQCFDEIRREFDPKSLQAFDLFATQGKPAQEVGKQLGMTPNAVFLVKHRIMKRIKELLPKMEDAW
jgi:RNA polymerase sigma-70 factor (ECF subfamily)